ncbi:hypothetical protein MHYP_G00104430 [Metynnis hypsauchen]
MKIFLVFSLFLISAGPADCDDVTGYTGGRVHINCRYDHMRYMNHTKYFCKLSRSQCTDKILSETQTTSDPERRVFFANETVPGFFGVLIKNVSRQDGGTYRCGVEDTTTKPTDVTLQVKEDPCCGKTFTQETHPGETVTFTCEYPQESKYLNKYLYKVNGRNYRVVIFALGLSVQNGSFSLFDHPEENLFNVSIRHVTEEDGGVYLCGVQGRKQGDLNSYFSLFNEMQLQVTAFRTSTWSPVIISVCVCVVLLLIGGLLLIYKLRRNRTEGSRTMHISPDNTDNADYENDRPGNQNILSQSPVYQKTDLQIRMKALFICTLYLISGPAGCFDVIGYQGGSVMIYCTPKVDAKYFCKLKQNQCENAKPHEIFEQNRWIHTGKLALHDSSGTFSAIFRQLSLQDDGTYRCGENGKWSHDINLRVIRDPCCMKPKMTTAIAGETVTVRCPYPEQFETNNKYFYKWDGHYFTRVIDITQSQRGRFSISDDRRSKVLSVRIRDVRGDDGGVYFCAVWTGGDPISYFSLYTEIQLDVFDSDLHHHCDQNPDRTVTQKPECRAHYVDSSIIITASVCVTLLLIGGSALIYYRFKNSSPTKQTETNDTVSEKAHGKLSLNFSS